MKEIFDDLLNRHYSYVKRCRAYSLSLANKQVVFIYLALFPYFCRP